MAFVSLQYVWKEDNMPKSLYTDIELPDIVRRAITLATRMEFPLLPEGRPAGYQGPPSACIPQVGRLLQVLAAGKPAGQIGEQGTGAGVGTAWIASGLSSDSHLISAEVNPVLATTVAELFTDYTNIEIRVGDWHEVMKDGAPYDLLFMDAGIRADLDPTNWEAITALVKVGGQFVMDDLTPIELWPTEWESITDRKREFAFANTRVVGAEVRTTPTTTALIVTRLY
jgi:predicted O-methyltransferase YrrM